MQLYCSVCGNRYESMNNDSFFCNKECKAVYDSGHDKMGEGIRCYMCHQVVFKPGFVFGGGASMKRIEFCSPECETRYNEKFVRSY